MLTFSDYTKSNFLFPAEKKDCFRIAGLLLQFFEFALNHLQFLLQIFRFGFQEFLSLALRHPLIFLPEPAAHHSAVASSPSETARHSRSLPAGRHGARTHSSSRSWTHPSGTCFIHHWHFSHLLSAHIL